MGRSSTSVPKLFAFFFPSSTDAIWMGAYWEDNMAVLLTRSLGVELTGLVPIKLPLFLVPFYGTTNIPST